MTKRLLKKGGGIAVKPISKLFDLEAKHILSDRSGENEVDTEEDK